MEQREHSKAYTNFFRQLNATGMERAYGAYALDTLEKIHDWERSDVEKTIWRGFKYKDDADLAELVTKLQQYDGIEALKERYSKGIMDFESSWKMIFIAEALYKATLIDDYLDYIIGYYDKTKDFGVVSVLSHLKPCTKLYRFFKSVYLDSNDSTARSIAVDGMLCCKGHIKDPESFEERFELVGMKRAFISDDRIVRRKKLLRFENGDFDNIPRTYGLVKKMSQEEAIRYAREKKSQEDPGELVTGIIDATESGVYIVFYEAENMYIPSVLSEEMAVKPAIGDKVVLLNKQKGQSIIKSFSQE